MGGLGGGSWSVRGGGGDWGELECLGGGGWEAPPPPPPPPPSPPIDETLHAIHLILPKEYGSEGIRPAIPSGLDQMGDIREKEKLPGLITERVNCFVYKLARFPMEFEKLPIW